MYLLNPHSLDMFKTPVAYKLVGKKPLRKYEAFFDAFIESGVRDSAVETLMSVK